jgi:DNA-binding NtrC family response regulator
MLDFATQLLSYTSTQQISEFFVKHLSEQKNVQGVLFFTLNSNKTQLVLKFESKTGFIKIPTVNLSDRENPICHSFFTKKYAVPKALSFAHNSSYYQLFEISSLSLEAWCIPTFVDGIAKGVFVILSKRHKLLEKKKIIKKITIFDKSNTLLTAREYLQNKIFEMEAQTQQISQHNRQNYIKQYVDLNWLDVSPTAEHFKRNIIQASRSNLNLLITGNKGQGKARMAKIISHISNQSLERVVIIDCQKFNTIRELSFELFGIHNNENSKKMNTTSAFKRADKGTLILKNIDVLNGKMQRKVYEVLKGNNKKSKKEFEVRLICTQSEELHLSRLEPMTADLYKIIAQLVIKVPSLGDNPENISPLADYFLSQYKNENNREISGISCEAKNFLLESFRQRSAEALNELIIESAIKTKENSQIEKDTLQVTLGAMQSVQNSTKAQTEKSNVLHECLRYYEINLIEQMLLQTRGNLSLSAKKLGVPRRTLTHKCAKLGIKRALK